MMSMNDAILLAVIGLMLYGIVQHFRIGDEFWFSPIGNLIGALGVTVVAGAAHPLTLQDEFIIWVALALGLYWFSKGKQQKTKRTRPTFEQVFETVEVAPVGEDDADGDQPEPEVEEEPEPVAEHRPFMWNGA